eukprot:6109536-Amphidinium_carterae.1
MNTALSGVARWQSLFICLTNALSCQAHFWLAHVEVGDCPKDSVSFETGVKLLTEFGILNKCATTVQQGPPCSWLHNTSDLLCTARWNPLLQDFADPTRQERGREFREGFHCLSCKLRVVWRGWRGHSCTAFPGGSPSMDNMPKSTQHFRRAARAPAGPS